jgi:ribonuclease P protein component
LVVHALMSSAEDAGRRSTPDGASAENITSTAGPTLDASKVGFVVSKAVGNSVVRHRVSRRLRHVVRDRLAALPAGTSLVVRALPAAADATSDELARDFDAALRRLLPSQRFAGDR